MSTIRISRGTIVQAIVDKLSLLRTFNLVKPYQGELDRYSKKAQIQDQTFPAQVNIQVPFALVISKDREASVESRSMKFRHELSVYIGVAKDYNFSSVTIPSVFDILTECANTLINDHKPLVPQVGRLVLVSEGEYLVSTQLFTVYDQKWFENEVAF